MTGLPASYDFTSPAHAFTIVFETAGLQSITATDPVATISSTSNAIEITAAAMSQFALSIGSPVTAGDAESVIVEAEDAYGNEITNYLGTIHFTSSDPQAIVPANYTFQMADGGEHTFSDGVTLETAGSQTVTVTSLGTPSYTGTSSTITVNPAAATTFGLTTAGLPGVEVPVSVTAYDAYGNVATGYDGTLDFSTTDAHAILPTTDTLSDGTGTFDFTFSTTGSYTVTATDSVDVDITGSTPVNVYKQPTQPGPVTSSAPQTFYGQTVTITATFSTTQAGNSPPTGTVAFYDGSTFLGTAPLIVNNASAITDAITPALPGDTLSGQSLLTTSSLSPGNHDIRAVYSGDRNYTSATSDVPVTVVVSQATTSTTLSSTTTTQGTVLTASVVVTSPGNPPLTGQVAFYEDGVLLGVEPVVNGVATYNVGAVSGSHTYSAVYSSGDTGTSAASGSMVTVSTDGPQIVGLSRLGFNQRPTVIVLTFNQPLDVTTAQNRANYVLYNANTGHRYAIASALYNPATLTVSVVPWVRLPVLGKYVLEVVGTGTSGVTNANGLALDGVGSGQPGSNFVTEFNWRALAAPNSPPAVIYVNGQPEDIYHGGFQPYFHAVYAATQYYVQHLVHRGGPVPVAAVKTRASLRAAARPKVVIDGAPKAVTKKLVTTRMDFPKVSKHRNGHR